MTSGPPYAMEWWLTEGDTEDWKVDVLVPETGEVRDLTGTTVTITMVPTNDWDDPVMEDASCTHDDTGGRVTYDVQLDDVDEPGDYYAQLKIVDASGGIKHYPEPRDGRWIIHIMHKFESTDTDAT